MQYFETDEQYNEVPQWVIIALGIGYRWGKSDSRRIGLISMPCESEAAGLIALGSLRKDLERATANHLDTHFDLLVRKCHEHQNLQMPAERSDWHLRNIDDTYWRFVEYDTNQDALVVENAKHRFSTKRKGKKIPNLNGPCRRYLMRSSALEWQIRDSPIPQIFHDEEFLNYSDYVHLPGCDGAILNVNLSRSYEGLVLIGSGAARDSNYMHKFYASGFNENGQSLFLGGLLTLHQHHHRITRLRFLNERKRLDEELYPANLVIADGITALLTADNLFPDCDIIGVCSRDSSAETTLQLKDFLNDKSRFYKDLDTNQYLSSDMPAGMFMRVLQRRG